MSPSSPCSRYSSPPSSLPPPIQQSLQPTTTTLLCHVDHNQPLLRPVIRRVSSATIDGVNTTTTTTSTSSRCNQQQQRESDEGCSSSVRTTTQVVDETTEGDKSTTSNTCGTAMSCIVKRFNIASVATPTTTSSCSQEEQHQQQQQQDERREEEEKKQLCKYYEGAQNNGIIENDILTIHKIYMLEQKRDSEGNESNITKTDGRRQLLLNRSLSSSSPSSPHQSFTFMNSNNSPYLLPTISTPPANTPLHNNDICHDNKHDDSSSGDKDNTVLLHVISSSYNTIPPLTPVSCLSHNNTNFSSSSSPSSSSCSPRHFPPPHHSDSQHPSIVVLPSVSSRPVHATPSSSPTPSTVGCNPSFDLLPLPPRRYSPSEVSSPTCSLYDGLSVSDGLPAVCSVPCGNDDFLGDEGEEEDDCIWKQMLGELAGEKEEDEEVGTNRRNVATRLIGRQWKKSLNMTKVRNESRRRRARNGSLKHLSVWCRLSGGTECLLLQLHHNNHDKCLNSLGRKTMFRQQTPTTTTATTATKFVRTYRRYLQLMKKRRMMFSSPYNGSYNHTITTHPKTHIPTSAVTTTTPKNKFIGSSSLPYYFASSSSPILLSSSQDSCVSPKLLSPPSSPHNPSFDPIFFLPSSPRASSPSSSSCCSEHPSSSRFSLPPLSDDGEGSDGDVSEFYSVLMRSPSTSDTCCCYSEEDSRDDVGNKRIPDVEYNNSDSCIMMSRLSTPTILSTQTTPTTTVACSGDVLCQPPPTCPPPSCPVESSSSLSDMSKWSLPSYRFVWMSASTVSLLDAAASRDQQSAGDKTDVGSSHRRADYHVAAAAVEGNEKEPEFLVKIKQLWHNLFAVSSPPASSSSYESPPETILSTTALLYETTSRLSSTSFRPVSPPIGNTRSAGLTTVSAVSAKTQSTVECVKEGNRQSGRQGNEKKEENFECTTTYSNSGATHSSSNIYSNNRDGDISSRRTRGGDRG
eukprot:GHVS01057263.1.p1 GENE.GHVS01057263.1~~GHVS01057263.1.p1  ORF type:complete len:1019 (+),score=276.62 GHVS01057263.1:159-3059(+)